MILPPLRTRAELIQCFFSNCSLSTKKRRSAQIAKGPRMRARRTPMTKRRHLPRQHLLRDSRANWPRGRRIGLAPVILKTNRAIETCSSKKALREWRTLTRSRKRFKRKRNSLKHRNCTNRNSRPSFKSRKSNQSSRSSILKTIWSARSRMNPTLVSMRTSMNTLARWTMLHKISKNFWSKNWWYLKICVHSFIGFIKVFWGM